MSPEHKSFEIITLEIGPLDNFIHIIHDLTTNSAAIIDPAWDIDIILNAIHERGAILTDILITHSHADHINGLVELLERHPVPVHISEQESVFWNKCPNDAILHKDGDSLSIGDTKIYWLLTPGHTPGSSCFSLHGALITGDTLFVFGCGRCDLKGGDVEQMYQSLQRLRSEITAETIIYTSHDYSIQPSCTMAEQIEGNPFFHQRDLVSFTQYRLVEHDQVRQSPYAPVLENQL